LFSISSQNTTDGYLLLAKNDSYQLTQRYTKLVTDEGKG